MRHYELYILILFMIGLFLSLSSVSCSHYRLYEDSTEEEKVALPLYDSHLKETSSYFVILGDLQSYMNDNNIAYYEKSISWIKCQIENGINIKALFQVGDITENNSINQWQLFRDKTIILESMVPYFVTTGNHDYDWDNFKIKERNSTHVSEFARFKCADDRIVSLFESNKIDNYVSEIDNESRLYLISLEFGPREEVISWAEDYVLRNPDSVFILLTHEWLTRFGERVSSNSYAEAQFSGYSTYSTPEQLWNRLVKPNDNILCVLCGHNGFSAKLFSKNTTGRDVPQVLFNLQYQNNGGDGLVQLWEVPAQSDSVYICAYDTINNDWYMPDSTSISFRIRY